MFKQTFQDFATVRDRDKSFLSFRLEAISNLNDKSKNYVEEKKEEEFVSDFNYPNLDNKSIKLIVYINEQIKLYANLAITRNSLWKKYLDSIFPIKLLFNQINNKKLLKGQTNYDIKVLFLNFFKKKQDQPLPILFYHCISIKNL